MNKTLVQRTCGDCKFFLHHYVKCKSGLRSAHCGHCTKSEIIKQKKKVAACSFACEYWQSIIFQNFERKRVMTEVLKDMANQIEEIAAIFKEDIL